MYFATGFCVTWQNPVSNYIESGLKLHHLAYYFATTAMTESSLLCLAHPLPLGIEPSVLQAPLGKFLICYCEWYLVEERQYGCFILQSRLAQEFGSATSTGSFWLVLLTPKGLKRASLYILVESMEEGKVPLVGHRRASYLAPDTWS